MHLLTLHLRAHRSYRSAIRAGGKAKGVTSAKRKVVKADIDTLSKAIEAGKIPANTQFVIQTPVKLGELENDLYPITEGLKPNAKVATTKGAAATAQKV